MSELKQIPEQIDVGKRVANALNNGKDVVIIDAPTGWGKTGLAYQIYNQTGKRTLVLNNNNVLVNQYIDLIENNAPECVSCKGKNNYVCGRDSTMTPASSRCTKKSCPLTRMGKCEYYRRRELMELKKLVISNYQLIFSLLDAGAELSQYDLIICDECHNIENIIVDYATVMMSIKICEDIDSYNSSIKRVKTLLKLDKDNLIEYAKELKQIVLCTNAKNYIEKFNEFYNIIIKMSEIISAIGTKENDHGYNDYLDALLGKWSNFKGDNEKQNFLYDSEDRELHKLVPLKIDKIFNRYMKRIAPQMVLMSATVINPNNMINDFGFDKDKVEYIELESKFDKSNRPIVPLGVTKVKITDDNYENSNEFKILIETIINLLKTHSQLEQSGLIYCNSYKLCNMIYRNIQGKTDYKILMNTNASETKKVLEEFLDTSVKKRLLISPSFAEGVNFNDDISRFQIIPKVPYLYLGSNRIATKCRQNGRWYTNKTIENIIQVAGRSVRSKTDEAVTYILDSSFSWCYNQYKEDYPKWFDEAIVKGGDL